jgi:hypothetical protein
MSKKTPSTRISMLMPTHWIKMLDQEAKRCATTRTQIVKSLLIDFCLRRASK